MVRNGLAFVIAAAFGAMSLTGCGDEIKSTTPGGTGGSGTGGGSNLDGATGSGCTDQCCPTAAECYVSGQTGPGAECLAKRENDPNGVQQFRQTWIRATTPLGNTSSTVYGILSHQSNLPWAACNMSDPTDVSGYIQAIDMDVSKGEARIGFTKWVDPANIQDAYTSGLCMISGTVPAGDPWSLPESEMSPTTNWPPGLPAPMARATTPWNFAPSHAKMIDADFDITDDATRRSLLEKLAPGGEYGMQNFNAVFYYDKSTGYSHGYAPLSYVIVYALSPDSYIAIPIREVETKGKVNDPMSPNCMGAYRGDVLDRNTGCQVSSDPTAPDYYAWGCKDNSCPAGQGPYTTKAYFLITELEQVYSSLLQQTLCVSYPGTIDQGATADQIFGVQGMDPATAGCRNDPRWNPSDPTGAGLPKGDWCAATNSPRTDTCHDAWRSESFHTFSAFPIRADTCSP